MDSFEWNKIAAALLVGALLYMVVSISAEAIYHVEAPQTAAYVVEGLEGEAAVAEEAVVEDAGPSFLELVAMGSSSRGERVFRRCQTCHTVDSGGANRTGPNLWNVVGNDVGAHDGFNYSEALLSVDGNWTYEALDAYLENPSAAIPGNKMSFAGLRKPEERADVIFYLRQQSDNPLPLPEVVEEAAEEVMDDVQDAVEDAMPSESDG